MLEAITKLNDIRVNLMMSPMRGIDRVYESADRDGTTTIVVVGEVRATIPAMRTLYALTFDQEGLLVSKSERFEVADDSDRPAVIYWTQPNGDVVAHEVWKDKPVVRIY